MSGRNREINFMHQRWKIELADSDLAGYLTDSVIKNLVPWFPTILTEFFISYCLKFFRDCFKTSRYSDSVWFC